MLGDQSPRWNVKRGLIRFWILFVAVWFSTAGGIWIAVWSDDLLHIGREFIESLKPSVDYDALCVKLRRQRAAGGPVDEIPAIPALELVVNTGVGRIVAAPGRCLVVFAKEEGIELIPVAFKVVRGDGSTLREIEDNAGHRRPISDFPALPPVQGRIPDYEYQQIYWSLAFIFGVPAVIFGVPAVLFVIGWGFWWAAMGFRSDHPRKTREPPNLEI